MPTFALSTTPRNSLAPVTTQPPTPAARRKKGSGLAVINRVLKSLVIVLVLFGGSRSLNAQDFTLSVTPLNPSLVSVGASAKATVSIAAADGVTRQVTLSTPCATGATCTFSAVTVTTSPEGTQSVLTVKPTGATPVTNTIVITALAPADGGAALVQHSASLALSVQTAGSASPAVQGGQSGAPTPAVQVAPPGTPTTNVAGTGKQIGTVEGIATIDPPDTGTPRISGIDSSGNLSFGENGAIAEKLLNDTICNKNIPQGVSNCDLSSKGTYALIHVLKWGPGLNSPKLIQSTNWYVYHNHGDAWSGHWNQADFSGNNRFYGATKIVVLYVHLNAAVDTCNNTYQARYQLTITKRVPSNIQAVQQLAQLIFPAAQAQAAARLETPSCPNVVITNVWGGGVIDVGYKTSDITVDSYLVTKDNTTTPPTTTATPLSASLSMINEAKQWWDVSIAVPVKSVSSLQYVSSNNTIVPTQIHKQSVFAAVDFYLPPVDLAGTTYNFIPHPIIGVSMASQPLHSILVGGAIGLTFAELFVGADFVKQQTLASGLYAGGPGTPSELSSGTSYKYKAQFTVGVNLPIKAAAASLKKATK